MSEPNNTSCNHDCANCSSKQDGSCSGPSQEDAQVAETLSKIRHKIVVLSGKGGVGKTTVAVNLAMALALEGRKVGLLDVDVHGPSVPTMLGVKGSRCEVDGDKILPVKVAGVPVISVDFFLEDTDSAVIWKGPMKYGVIKQFISEVAWGELDYLVVDCPPGTGDEPLAICQMLQDGDTSAVIVTTPQEDSAADVRKSIDFCKKLSLPVEGVIENMSGFACPHCGEITYIFKQGGGEALAAKMDVPFLGKIPIDPQVCEGADLGRPIMHYYGNTPTARAFLNAIHPILEKE